MNDWITTLVFNYGETQCIWENTSKLVYNSDLPSLPLLLTELANLQPTGSEPITIQNMLSIRMFNGAFIDYVYSSENSEYLRFDWDTLNTTTITNLINEIVAASPVPDTPPEVVDIPLEELTEETPE